MELLAYSIFKEEKMKTPGLDGEAYNFVYGKYRTELIEIKEKYTKESIEKLIQDDPSLENKENLFHNILHVLDGIKYLEHKGTSDSPEEQAEQKELDYSIIKDITIGKLLDWNFSISEGQINIEIENLLDKISEEKKSDVWDESVVENTLSEKFLIENKDNVRLINTLSDYTGFVYELESKMPNGLVSRGQKDCSYDLVPSIYRKHEKKQDVHAKGYEHTFRQRLAYYSNDVREKTSEELRAEGQHYGLPTEYLDFTEAHIISLLFAIEEYTYKDNHSIVFFVDSTLFNKESVDREVKLINLQLESEKNYLKDYSSCSYFMKLPNINERIHFQKGCFLRVSPQDFIDKKDFINNLKDKCGIAIIHKDCKEDILKELFSLGINFESIYPDKENLVNSIKFSYEVIQGNGGGNK